MIGDRLSKPPHGAPCNRCGLCCENQLCVLAQHVFGDRDGPCPALSYDGQLSICGLVQAPAKFVRVRAAMVGAVALTKGAVTLIGAGMGCDAQVDGEPADQRFRALMVRWHETHGLEVLAALKAWGFGKSVR